MTATVLLVTKVDFGTPNEGGTLRVNAVVSHLRAAGFDVHAVSIRDAEGRRHNRTQKAFSSWHGWLAAGTVAASAARVGSLTVARWYSYGAAERISQLLHRNSYAAVIIEYSQLLVYRQLFTDTAVVLDMHNVEHELLENYASSTRSGLARLVARYETSRVRRLESRVRRRVDAVVTVSERDADAMRRTLGAATVVTAPNGVSESAFGVERSAPTGPPAVVFIANLSWRPNVDAAHWLVAVVWPLVRRSCPAAELQLVGRRPVRSLLAYDGVDGVTVHPDVPSTLPYLEGATVATAPLRAAGGTRLKILEAMATGTPVVATSRGATGLEHLARGGGMVVADNCRDFAAALVRFIDSPGDPEAVRRQVDSYRWAYALQPFVDVVKEIAA